MARVRCTATALGLAILVTAAVAPQYAAAARREAMPVTSIPSVTSRISVGPGGMQLSLMSYQPATTPDGRFVVFSSPATNLAPGVDTNPWFDAYLLDRRDGSVSLISVARGGRSGNAESYATAISADGRYVAFVSKATDLTDDVVSGAFTQVFVRDRARNVTMLVSRRGGGGPAANGVSGSRQISADGRYVAFSSVASNLIDGDTNRLTDVYVHDLVQDTTVLVSRGATGQILNSDTFGGQISGDGRYVLFTTDATNVVPGATTYVYRVYLRDVVAGTTTLLAQTPQGAPANGVTAGAGITADGRFILFSSVATDLGPDDANGRDLDLYILDRVTGTMDIVTRTDTGQQVSGAWIADASISADGRYVAFLTDKAFVSDDTNWLVDAYVRDRVEGTTRRASLTSAGEQITWRGVAYYGGVPVTNDGAVLFTSEAPLVPEDTNGTFDIYINELGAARNTPPVVRVPPDATVVAGVSFTADGSFADPDVGETWTGTVDYGAGAGPRPLAIRSDKTFTLSATYAQVGVFTVRVTIMDSAGVSGAAAFLVTVVNTVPTVDIGPDLAVFAGEDVQGYGSFVDPDAGQSWSATIDYGDGNGATPLALAADKTFRVEHRYARPGTYVVVVVVTDSAGRPGEDQRTITVKRRPLVFLPGIFGSELDWGQEGICQRPVWFNTCQALAPGEEDFFDVLKFEAVDGTVRPIRPEITTNGRLAGGPGGGPYDDVRPFFEAAGYVYGADLSIVTYDWRSSVTTLRDRLDVEIRGLRKGTGAPKVDLVAHSLGGLIVRSFLLGGSERANVANAVLLGAPELGTPLFMQALLGGICLPLGIDQCILSGDEVKDVARTIPSGLELSPSREYYAVFPSAEGDDHPAAYVDLRSNDRKADRDALIAREIEAGVLAPLIPAADAFHADDATWLSDIPPGVRLTLIAGSGWNTVGQIVEQTTYFRLGPLKFATGTNTDARFIDGDAVVVTESAANLTGGTAPPNVRRVYAAWQHVGLTARGALPIALDILDGADPVTVGRAYDHPLRPTGVIVSVHSPAELIVENAAGDRIGSLDGSNFDSGMENATYGRLADTKYAGVPIGVPYTVTLAGTGEGEAKIKVRRTVDGVVAETFVFTHVPLRTGSRGMFGVDAAGRPAELALDLDGDGTADVRIAANALVGPSAADLASPIITVVGPRRGQAVVGAFDLDWIATDPLSGVAGSFAVVDRDGSAPLVVERPGRIELAPGAHVLDVFADDQAGNIAVAERQLMALSYRWLMPLAREGEIDAVVGRTIPVRFAVRGANGTPAEDKSVVVDLVDEAGVVVLGPLRYGRTPASGVLLQAGTYQADLTTRGIGPGSYRLRVRFDSAALTGEFALRVLLR